MKTTQNEQILRYSPFNFAILIPVFAELTNATYVLRRIFLYDVLYI
jgi:hypothetical protein